MIVMIFTHYQAIFVIFYLLSFIFRNLDYFCYFLRLVVSELSLFLLSLVDNHYADKKLVYKVASYD